MDKAKLEALLESVDKSTGPDREIDGALHAMFGVTPEGARKDTYANEWFTAPGIQWQHPSYTASIDAALALVEQMAGGESTPSMVYNIDLNWHASAHSEMAYVAELFVADGDPCVMLSFHAQAHTWPLAILAALLKALIAQEATCAS